MAAPLGEATDVAQTTIGLRNDGLLPVPSAIGQP
jgi:hypothetical protein